MANFFSNMMGNDSIAKIAGEKAGDIVETAVNKVMGGGEGKEEKGGGFGVSDALKLVGEGKDEDKGGFGVSDALKLVGEGKDEDKGGFGVGDALKLMGEGSGNAGDNGYKKEGERKGLDVTEALGGFFK
ncbi:protein qua-1-like [Pempheris klunzingeri]|uniref:protein qua-1-like n=1 Tax=Pempheris klunzingeri TaxID=3127111 RepID=UPI00397F7AA6